MKQAPLLKITLLIMLFLVSTMETSAQQWTPEQQEVWEFEIRCYQVWIDKDYEGRKSCFHEEYRGWFSNYSMPLPLNEKLDQRAFDKNKWVGFNLMPHRISIHGNIAIIQYSGTLIVEGPDGEDTTNWVHWTDIALKENGRWSWIADHGHPGPSNE